jgi:hypothetical protein
MRTLLHLFVPLFLASSSSFAQELPASERGTLVITTTNMKEKISYRDTKVETESGEVFSCSQVISAKTSCVLSGVPSGRVKLTASGRGSVSRWVELSPGDNTIRLTHNYRGVFIASGVTLVVVGALSFALLGQQEDVLIANATVTGLGGAYLLTGIFASSELVQINGKVVRGRASKAK